MSKALVLGFYQSESSDSITFTPVAQEFNQQVGGKLNGLVQAHGPGKNKSKVFYDLHESFPVVAVVGLGSQDAGFNESEDLDEQLENVRQAISVGVKAVRGEKNVQEIVIDDCNQPQAASEGANLVVWSYDDLKSEKYKKKPVKLRPYSETARNDWNRGTLLAEAQNICRRLGESPANMMTPTKFSSVAEELFKNNPAVKVHIRDEDWAKKKSMGAFLSVGRGSCEPSKFLEIHYNNKPDSKPFALVGKGVCFDSGGISLKPAAKMDEMRYDMGGAANVVGTIYALANLRAEVNVIGLTPLVENLPSGSATKPGDVVFAMNGKSIQVDNTDAEGRLILADALCYAHEFKPQAILDIATLTGAMMVALGSAATGVWSTNTKLFNSLQKAGSQTGDRVWRMPLYNHYTPQVTESILADCLNIGKDGPAGGCCTAAAFLREFVTCPNWMHLDIAGVMTAKDEYPYYCKGMPGRPVRTLYQFLVKHFQSN